ncbi:MAG: hypothetical protein GC150_10985 [Rhizobiales bacterium]|nr:hypothetical protein [Hyphomicrobiales bacterium]
MPTPAAKTNPGNFFEDFHLGQQLAHATPRTITAGDVALYLALTGGRFAVASSSEFARAIGYRAQPVDDLLVFHLVFGKSVPDVSLNAVANLGYAECRFLAPAFVGDTLSATSQVIGLKENSNGATGVVHVRTSGTNQAGTRVLEFARWVMVNKRDPSQPAGNAGGAAPVLADHVGPERIGTACPPIDVSRYDFARSGARHRFDDYAVGECIDHVDGMTIEEAEHQMATRLYQNTAKVHFNQLAQAGSRFGRRLIYGGHIISLARALSYNGLENAFHIAAINGGRHVAPTFAGDTIHAWSEVTGKSELAGRRDVGAVRLRTRALKNHTAEGFPQTDRATGKDHPALVLDLDYWCLMPR